MSLLSWLLPYLKLEIESSLTPDEVGRVLRPEITERPEAFFVFSSDIPTPYVGTLTKDKFKIRRVIQYRNSFLPIMSGTIAPLESGSRISVTMRPFLFVLAFMTVWLSGAGFGCLGALAAMSHGFSPPLLIPFGMFLFGVALTNIAFGVEARKSARWLRGLIPPKEEPAFVGPYR